MNINNNKGNTISKNKKLDKIDLKLLQELENDSRQTLSQIAKKLKTSQQVISYRMNSLEERKIIGEYYTIINITKLGYTNYRTMIRLSNFNEEKHKAITEYLMSSPNVLWIVDCAGRWDLIVNIMARNILEYSRILTGLKNKFSEQIQNHDVLTTVEITYFGRDYLTKKTREIRKRNYVGGEDKIEQIDETDQKILSLISRNARMNAVEIADKIKTSPNTVISRIKGLKKLNIIQGFKPLIHLENTPYHGYKALIKFQNITEQKEREIISYLNNNTSIVGIITLIGMWDFEIEFEVETREEMLKITREFRDRFKDVIKEFEIIQLFREYKYDFFPETLLKKK